MWSKTVYTVIRKKHQHVSVDTHTDGRTDNPKAMSISPISRMARAIKHQEIKFIHTPV